MSPTAKTLTHLRRLGYTAAVTAHWNAFARVKQDLFGCIDVLAVRPGEAPLGVQATTSDHHAHRLAKAKAVPALRAWLHGMGLDPTSYLRRAVRPDELFFVASCADALAMARQAEDMGFEIMVGSMVATSLAMAPAMLVAQRARVVDLEVREGGVRGVKLADGRTLPCDRVVLAPGNSARELFELFAARGWAIEAKPFAVGFLAEHPQALIDRIQYGSAAG